VKKKLGEAASDALLMIQHSSVYTLGRGGTVDNLKFAPNTPDSPHKVFRVERGGEVTWLAINTVNLTIPYLQNSDIGPMIHAFVILCTSLGMVLVRLFVIQYLI
jgi:hypothetical protein